MKFLLVDKYDNIVTSVNLASNVGLNGAKTYFKGVKLMPKDEEFDKLVSQQGLSGSINFDQFKAIMTSQNTIMNP